MAGAGSPPWDNPPPRRTTCQSGNGTGRPRTSLEDSQLLTQAAGPDDTGPKIYQQTAAPFSEAPGSATHDAEDGTGTPMLMVSCDR